MWSGPPGLAARWVVDNGTFKAKTEVETGMKTTKVCTLSQIMPAVLACHGPTCPYEGSAN